MQEEQHDIISALLQEVRATVGEEAMPMEVERELECRLRLTWGGQRAYVKKVAVNADARALAIRSRYNMVNRRQLQAEFGISRGQFYKILRGG